MSTYYVDGDNGDDLNDGLSEANAFKTIQKGVDSMAVAGDVLYIQKTATPYKELVTTPTGISTNSSPMQVIGYNATPGDDPEGDNRPLLDQASAHANGFVLNFSHLYFANMVVKNATGDGITNTSDSSTRVVMFENIKVEACGGDGWDSVGSNKRWYFHRCEAVNNTLDGFDTGEQFSACRSHGNTEGWDVSQGKNFAYCEAHDNSADGFDVDRGGTCFACAAYSNTGDGFSELNVNIGTYGFYINCTSTDNGQHGFDHMIQDYSELYVNCITSNNGNKGWDFEYSKSQFLHRYNNSYNNTNGHGVTLHSTEMSLDPQYADEINGDLEPGANMKDAGVPWLSGLMSQHTDIGCQQRAEGGAASPHKKLVSPGVMPQ